MFIDPEQQNKNEKHKEIFNRPTNKKEKKNNI